MKKIPVLVNYHRAFRIGTLLLDDDIKVPLNGVFTIGGKIGWSGEKTIDDFELSCISLTTNEYYESYLKSEDRKRDISLELREKGKRIIDTFKIKPSILGRI